MAAADFIDEGLDKPRRNSTTSIIHVNEPAVIVSRLATGSVTVAVGDPLSGHTTLIFRSVRALVEWYIRLAEQTAALQPLRQPRERAVPCRSCSDDTWETSGICVGCQGLAFWPCRVREGHGCSQESCKP